MADTDLTQTIIPYLDRHLVFPLLAHLLETGLFPEKDVIAAQFDLARSTNMVDYAVHLHEQLNGEDAEPPAEFSGKREKAVETNERLEQEAQAVLEVIEKPEVAQALRQDKSQNLAYLKEHYGLTLEQITVLYHYGQFQFTCGNYSAASDYLYHFRILSTDTDLNTSAHWGKLAADILSGKWAVALDELNTLREAVDARAGPLPGAVGAKDTVSGPLFQLHARSWVLHWSLFVYLKNGEADPAVLRAALLDTFLAPAYLNTVQTSCPWLLRYIATVAVLSRRAAAAPGAQASGRMRHALKEVVRLVQLEAYQYKDPVTEFLRELYVEFDFERAQKELARAESVVADDFFLGDFREEFMENARYLITEAYCRIHQKIDIGDLSERLNLSRDEGEKWIVNLIRETRMGADAKIDLEKNVIQITRPPQPVYQSVIERTRGLAFRTQAMGVALERAGNATAQTEPPAIVEAAA